jgi:hypothetical protein
VSRRRVVYCIATWGDRQFRKSFEKLSADEQVSFLEKLHALERSLENASHPATDPVLRQTYRAKSYSGVVSLKGAALIEYSLGNLTRVIAKYPASKSEDAILLVAVSLTHDHERLKRLIKQGRAEIDGWSENS